LIADHPVIVAAELTIRLPEAVAMFSLKMFGSPGLSRLSYRMDDGVNFVVVNSEAFVA